MASQKSIFNRPWLTLLTTALLVALTYPAFEPDYGVGLDSSYVWGLNWLFDHDYHTLTHLIYPYGPLALLRLPVVEGGHFLPYLLFYTAIKFLFAWLVLVEAKRHDVPWLMAVVALVPACVLGNVDTFLVADTALLVFCAVEDKKTIPFIAASILSATALCIKSSLGLQSCGVLFAGWLLYTIRYKNWRESVRLAAIAVVLILAVGMVVYQSLPALLKAWWGIVVLTAGYSESMVLIVEHRMVALVILVVAMFSLPFVSKGRAARYMWLLMLIPLMANWKYGIVREDFWHFKQLVAFLFCFVASILVVQRRFHWPTWVVGAVAVSMSLVNLNSLRNDPSLKVSTASPVNVAKLTIGYNDLVQRSKDYIDSSMALRRLPRSTVELIGSGTVDCYPWEHIFVAANELRWQPRITIGAGFSPRLSDAAAANFRGYSAVDYIILHRPNYDDDRNLYSLDGAYLLNDEPSVILTIMENYAVVDTGWYGLLLKHRERPIERCRKMITTMPEDHRWGEWINLPREATLAAIKHEESLLGHMAKAVYKPDIYTVDYLMPDSTWRTYRYSSVMAEDGLWIGPMSSSFEELCGLFADSCHVARPIAIRLNSIHPKYHKERITVKFHNVY